MKYRRLKTLDSNGHPTLRYYPLKGIAYTNAFYGISNNVAEKIEGEVGEGVTLIGFSHGGDKLAKGLIFLDINETVVYMAILGEDDDRPDIGDIVNGYQRVIDTHYDGDDDVSGKGLNPGEWGVETLDNPYYLFTIVQPAGAEYSSEIDDDDAGEISPNPEHDPVAIWEYIVTFNSNGGTDVPAQKVLSVTMPDETTVYGTAVEPTAPTKEGNTFAGWYSDSELTTEYDFTAEVKTDTTLYAKWTPDSP